MSHFDLMNFLRGMAAMYFLMKLVAYVRTRRLINKIERDKTDYDVVLSDPPQKKE